MDIPMDLLAPETMRVLFRHGKNRAVRSPSHDPDMCPICNAVDIIEDWIIRERACKQCLPSGTFVPSPPRTLDGYLHGPLCDTHWFWIVAEDSVKR